MAKRKQPEAIEETVEQPAVTKKTKVDEAPAADDGIVEVEKKPAKKPAAVTEETKVDEAPAADDGVIEVEKKSKVVHHRQGGRFTV